MNLQLFFCPQQNETQNGILSAVPAKLVSTYIVIFGVLIPLFLLPVNQKQSLIAS
jgi:hypothetical protein